MSEYRTARNRARIERNQVILIWLLTCAAILVIGWMALPSIFR
jgi:hypothetical protein